MENIGKSQYFIFSKYDKAMLSSNHKRYITSDPEQLQTGVGEGFGGGGGGRELNVKFNTRPFLSGLPLEVFSRNLKNA